MNRRVDNSSVKSSYACDSLKLLQTDQLIEFSEIDLKGTTSVENSFTIVLQNITFFSFQHLRYQPQKNHLPHEKKFTRLLIEWPFLPPLQVLGFLTSKSV